MKNFLFIFTIFLIQPLYATTMCAQNDIVAVILDPSVKPTSKYYDSEGHWSAQTLYGTIYGEVKIESGKCFYRITHPVITIWTARSNTTNISACAEATSYQFLVDTDFRRKTFSLITN